MEKGTTIVTSKATNEEFDAYLEEQLPNMNRKQRRLFKNKREAMRVAILKSNQRAYLQTSGGSVIYGKSNFQQTGATASSR